MTAAIVLAAGLGKRLARATALPKWLAPVSPEARPVDVQLAALHGAGFEDVYVVVGAAATETVEAAVAPWRDRLNVDLILNPESASLNNWYSLLLGLQRWTTTAHDDVVVLNSDLFARPPWLMETITRLVHSKQAAALAIDVQRDLTHEAMKVRSDRDTGLVTGVGKEPAGDATGEYVGLSWWSRASGVELLAELRSFLNRPECADHWYEHGIRSHIDRGASYELVPVPSSAWVEIDDEADLESARSL